MIDQEISTIRPEQLEALGVSPWNIPEACNHLETTYDRIWEEALVENGLEGAEALDQEQAEQVTRSVARRLQADVEEWINRSG